MALANSLIQHNANRGNTRVLIPLAANGQGVVNIIQYQNLAAEVEGVANRIRDLVAAGTPPGDILVLAQRSAIGTPIYEALVARGVAVKSHYAEAELDDKDAQVRFALFKMFVNREDRVALRWLVGLNGNNWNAAGYRRIRHRCEQTGETPWTVLTNLSSGAIAIPHTQSIVAEFRTLVADLATLEVLTDLSQVIDHLFPAGMDSIRDIRELALTALQSVPAGDRAALLSELTTAITQPEIPTEIQDVRIMSLHKSKGLSAPVTIIAGCIEGLLPKQPEPGTPLAEAIATIEEQRRLFFVGITRVKSSPSDNKPGILMITYSQEMPMAAALGAGIAPAAISFGMSVLHASRFIQELGPYAPAPVAG